MPKSKDELGNRIKDQYENRTRHFLPRRTYTLLRIDGKAFHSYTRGCEKPFDYTLMDQMDQTAKFLCEQIQGAALAYVQSDEITILTTDFNKITTDAWFDGNLQKIVSVSASLATGYFNWYSSNNVSAGKLAFFDSRAWTCPDPVEVENTFIWRQQDATKNSVQMVARAHYPHKKLEGKNNAEMQEMIFQKGDNWNNYPIGAKRGRCIVYNGEKWEVVAPPIFTQDRSFLRSIIPVYENWTWSVEPIEFPAKVTPENR